MISFTVPGYPATKGSTRSFKHANTGQIVTVGDCEKLKDWEARVALFARSAGAQASQDPIEIQVCFLLPRPKAHFRSNGALKDTAPFFPAKKPDVDKMLRAILDALTGVAYLDDCQVVWICGKKLYATESRHVGAAIVMDVAPRGSVL